MIREEFEKNYRKNLKEIDIPHPWKDQLECISCLKERRDTKTLLVYNRQDGKKYILKIAEGAKKDTFVQENEALLKLFDQEKHYFPAPGILIREESVSCYLREYVEGDTLITVLKRHGCMPEPVLIGTGIRPTAAPEQYGYCQTDGRTDIYGLGMTLLYLASGCFDIKELKNVQISGQLKRIIKKATAFDPRARFHDAAQLRRVLTRLGRRHLHRRTYCEEN